MLSLLCVSMFVLCGACAMCVSFFSYVVDVVVLFGGMRLYCFNVCVRVWFSVVLCVVLFIVGVCVVCECVFSVFVLLSLLFLFFGVCCVCVRVFWFVCALLFVLIVVVLCFLLCDFVCVSL